MEKSSEAFRTISEVADDLDIPKHVLRFWEGKFPQVRPMKRGGGRRYYRPEDIDLLKGIRRLLYEEGYTIKGVQKVIRMHGLDFVKLCWQGPVGSLVAPFQPEAVEGDRAEMPAAPRRRGRQRAAAPAPEAAAEPAADPSGAPHPPGTNGSTAPFRLSRAQTRQLRQALADLAAVRELLAGE
ncbi:MAG: MerR family transcriptional regulator [Hyphomicrobiaceae bacterium]